MTRQKNDSIGNRNGSQGNMVMVLVVMSSSSIVPAYTEGNDITLSVVGDISNSTNMDDAVSAHVVGD